MTVGLKKFSEYNSITGASLRGDETILLADKNSNATVTASSISATASSNTISDSGNNLPLVKVGALVLISGFTDTAGELNGIHTVLSSDQTNLVIDTDITVNESAGQSVTVSEVSAMYQITIDEIASILGGGGAAVEVTYDNSGSGAVGDNVQEALDELFSTPPGSGASTSAVNNWSAAQRSPALALTDGATITPNFSLRNNFKITIGGNRTLANPTDAAGGQSGQIEIKQGVGGSHELAFGSNYVNPPTSLSSVEGAVDVCFYSTVDVDGTVYVVIGSTVKNINGVA